MPRLRRLKNYDYIERTEENYRDNSNSDDEESSGELFESSSPSMAGGFKQEKGWWSNSSIIQGLPEPKIREALAYYRLLINQLEEELILRKFSGHRNIDLNINGMRVARTYTQSSKTKERKRNTPVTIFLKKVQSLKPEARLKLEQEWTTILKEHYNGRYKT